MRQPHTRQMYKKDQTLSIAGYEAIVLSQASGKCKPLPRATSSLTSSADRKVPLEVGWVTCHKPIRALMQTYGVAYADLRHTCCSLYSQWVVNSSISNSVSNPVIRQADLSAPIARRCCSHTETWLLERKRRLLQQLWSHHRS